MIRTTGWEARFSELVAARLRAPFAWGEHDCVMFAADAVLAITGDDLAADQRGRYGDARSALEVIEEEGGIQELVTRRLGLPLGGAFARVGDVCLIYVAGRPALGICNGAEVLGPGAAGLVAVSIDQALRCWRVG